MQRTVIPTAASLAFSCNRAYHSASSGISSPRSFGVRSPSNKDDHHNPDEKGSHGREYERKPPRRTERQVEDIRGTWDRDGPSDGREYDAPQRHPSSLEATSKSGPKKEPPSWMVKAEKRITRSENRLRRLRADCFPREDWGLHSQETSGSRLRPDPSANMAEGGNDETRRQLSNRWGRDTGSSWGPGQDGGGSSRKNSVERGGASNGFRKWREREHGGGRSLASREADSIKRQSPPQRSPWHYPRREDKERLTLSPAHLPAENPPSSKWAPTKKLTFAAMEGLRALHQSDPKLYNRAALGEKFGISFEAVGRILRSRYDRKSEDGENAAEVISPTPAIQRAVAQRQSMRRVR